MSTTRRRCRGVACWVLLAGAAWWLHRLGAGRLAGPPGWRPHDLVGWWRSRGPLPVVFAAVREVLFWIGCYLCGLSVLVAFTGALRRRPLAGRRGRRRLPGARLVATTLGAWILGATGVVNGEPSFAADAGSTAADPGPAPQPAQVAPTLRYVGPGDAALLRRVGPTGPSTPVAKPLRRRLVGAGRSRRASVQATGPMQATGPVRATGAVRATGPVPTAVRRPRPRPPAGAAADPTGTTWIVQPGDDLWSIAAARLTRERGEPPAPAELAAYWWEVVQTNRAHLPNPDDPNLLLPGDRVTMPPLPPLPPPA